MDQFFIMHKRPFQTKNQMFMVTLIMLMLRYQRTLLNFKILVSIQINSITRKKVAFLYLHNSKQVPNTQHR